MEKYFFIPTSRFSQYPDSPFDSRTAIPNPEKEYVIMFSNCTHWELASADQPTENERDWDLSLRLITREQAQWFLDNAEGAVKGGEIISTSVSE